ncbi:MAG: inositol monophosphatase family protein [Thermoguttaceae bacterium]
MSTASSPLGVCVEAAQAAGKILRELLGTISVRHKKNRFDLVTEADVSAQKAIESILLGEFPDYRFLGEETAISGGGLAAVQGTSPFCWVVDPLDGTTNYVHGFPFFCTSIALLHETDVICGVIYNPLMDEMYTAELGGGAFLNGNKMAVSENETLETSLVSVSFPTETRSDSPDLQSFLRVIPRAQAIRRTGSTALNLAYVASGRFDASWSLQCHPWDIAAGVILVTESGGVARSPDGGIFSYNDPSPVSAAANEKLFAEVQKIAFSDLTSRGRGESVRGEPPT